MKLDNIRLGGKQLVQFHLKDIEFVPFAYDRLLFSWADPEQSQ